MSIKRESPFFFPYGQLTADTDNGEGKVTLSEMFDDEDALLQLDILQDWIGLLTEEYNEAHKRWGVESLQARGGLYE